MSILKITDRWFVAFVLLPVLLWFTSCTPYNNDEDVKNWQQDSLGCYFRTSGVAEKLAARYHILNESAGKLEQIFGPPNIRNENGSITTFTYYYGTHCITMQTLDTAADACWVDFSIQGGAVVDMSFVCN